MSVCKIQPLETERGRNSWYFLFKRLERKKKVRGKERGGGEGEEEEEEEEEAPMHKDEYRSLISPFYPFFEVSEIH